MQKTVWRVLIAQLGIAFFAATIGLLGWGARYGLAAAVAGLVAAIPAWAHGRVVLRFTAGGRLPIWWPQMLGEGLKIALSILGLLVVFTRLVPYISIPYFFAVYVACLMAYAAPLFFNK